VSITRSQDPAAPGVVVTASTPTRVNPGGSFARQCSSADQILALGGTRLSVFDVTE
jgi:hypothetical protein